MKWLDKLVQKTKVYKTLFRELGICKQELEHLQIMYDEQYKHLLNNVQINKGSKTIARRIIRLTNSLLKKEELVQTKKEIQVLCHEIIKGEK